MKVRHRNRTDLKPDSSERGWLHIDPGQCESGSTLTTSVDGGRIQEMRWKGPRSVSGWLHTNFRSSPLSNLFLLCWRLFLLWFLEPYWTSWCKADFRVGLNVWYQGESDGWRPDLIEKLRHCCHSPDVRRSDVAENWQPRKRCWVQSSRDNAHGFLQLDIYVSHRR